MLSFSLCGLCVCVSVYVCVCASVRALCVPLELWVVVVDEREWSCIRIAWTETSHRNQTLDPLLSFIHFSRLPLPTNKKSLCRSQDSPAATDLQQTPRLFFPLHDAH